MGAGVQQSGSAKVYLDGVLEGETTGGGTGYTGYTVPNVFLAGVNGVSFSHATFQSQGLIVWDYALTDLQIQNLWFQYRLGLPDFLNCIKKPRHLPGLPTAPAGGQMPIAAYRMNTNKVVKGVM